MEPLKEENPHYMEIKAANRKYMYPAAALGVFVACAIVALFFYTKSYENRTLPGLTIGDIAIGRMEQSELKFFLDNISQKLIADGIHFDLNYPGGTEKFTVGTEIITDTDVVPYITIDTESEAKRLVEYGKTGSFVQDALYLVGAKFHPESITLRSVFLRRDRLEQAIHEKIASHESPPHNASLSFTSYSPLHYTFTSSSNGFVYPIDDAMDQVERNWKQLQSPSVTLSSIPTEPSIQDADLLPLLPTLSQYFEAGSLILKKVDDTLGTESQWKISAANFAPLMTVSDEGGTKHFTLDAASTTLYLEKYIAPDIFVDASSGKFTVDADGRVKEFEPPQVGISLDTTTTVYALKSVFESRLSTSTNTPVIVTLMKVEPEPNNDSDNTFGIKEILGVGISNYSGSPANRIKNIKNALRKINGTLIKPGAEFSAIKYTEPYTLEAGYLAEKVIKGDEIKPEIGGGLCQVGTTLFRMAMNSGMKITERRNHSLVVSYYNDPRNGQPGTDATIYDPAPDFRFLNDTSSSILIQTEINDKTGELKFTLWGTSDGRKASYTRPTVSKWLPTGPTKFIQTTTLAPGVKSCQHAFPGAQTSFTYTRILADGTKEDVVYDSYYRPLPEICLVGAAVAPLAPVCPEGEICAPEDVPSDAKPLVEATVPAVSASST